MPNFRERTRIRRARIATGTAQALPSAPRPRPIVPQPSFTEWPVALPMPPDTGEEIETIIAIAEFEVMTYNDLRAFLKENELSAMGTKADLIERAVEFTKGEPIE